MFVSNLADRDADATITLRMEQLDWKGVAKVWDALSRESVVVDNGTISLHLGPWGYRVIRVQSL